MSGRDRGFRARYREAGGFCARHAKSLDSYRDGLAVAILGVIHFWMIVKSDLFYPALFGIALAVSLLTLFSMIKIWTEAFWKPLPAGAATEAVPLSGWIVPIAGLSLLSVALGLGAGPAFALALRAGTQLLNPSAYIAAVLGEIP